MLYWLFTPEYEAVVDLVMVGIGKDVRCFRDHDRWPCDWRRAWYPVCVLWYMRFMCDGLVILCYGLRGWFGWFEPNECGIMTCRLDIGFSYGA